MTPIETHTVTGLVRDSNLAIRQLHALRLALMFTAQHGEFDQDSAQSLDSAVWTLVSIETAITELHGRATDLLPEQDESKLLPSADQGAAVH